MTLTFKRLPAATAALLLAGAIAAPLAAQESGHTLHVIKVGTGTADLVEADVTDLELGESRTFVTESGKTVDILKAPEGIEIYIDGELIDLGEHADPVHGHVEHHERRIAVECENPEGCEDMLLELMDEDEGNVFVMRREIETVCGDDGECENMVWIEEDREQLSGIGDEALHEDDEHKVIIIRKEVTTDTE